MVYRILLAEGNFQTTKVARKNKNGVVTSYGLKYSFHIGLHERDRPLLELIKNKLDNRGEIYDFSDKKEAHLAIYRIEDLSWLIENIFSKYPLLTKGQATRYEQLRIGISQNLNRLESLEDFYIVETIVPEFNICSELYIDNWIVGFLNGEVSFTYSTKRDRIYPRVCLEHTDERVIKLIKDRLEIGPNILIRTRDTRKTTYRLDINSKKDILNIIQFLDQTNNFRGYKLIQYNE